MSIQQQAVVQRGPQELCSIQDAMAIVTKRIGKHVLKLGRAMGIDDRELENAEVDGSKYGTEEVAQKAYQVWCRNEPENATVGNLIRCLNKIGRNDIVKEIFPQSGPSKIMGSTVANDSSLTLVQLQANLRRQYNSLLLQGLPWMKGLILSVEKHFVNIEIEKEEANTRHKQKTKLEEIFLGESVRTRLFGKRKSCKILVEGDSGFGKTTLASKLCYDYGNKKSYMERFNVVLLVSLRKFDGNLEETICKAAFCSTNQQNSLFEIINRKSVETLIILDSSDEIAPEHINSILPLIRGKMLSHVSLVVTSRPGWYTEKNSVASGDVSYDTKLVWDSQYKLIGLNEDGQEKFVERHLKTYLPDVKKRIQQEIIEMKEKTILTPDFLKCPLFLFMVFIALYKPTRGLKHIRTKTELHKDVLKFLIRRYLTKCDSDTSKFDLFIFDNDKRPSYVDLMVKLGEMNLSAIQTKQFVFSREKVLDSKIFKLGILTETSFVDGLQKVVRYKPIHKSLFDFAGAYSLLISFRFGQRDEWKKKIVDLRPTVDSTNSSLVLPFLAGLLGRDAGALFDVLQIYADEYSEMFHLLTPTLCEVEITESVMHSLIPFLPTRWEMYWSKSEISSSLPLEILLGGLKVGKITEIVWDMANPVPITEDIEVDKLVLSLQLQKYLVNESSIQRIKCQSLVCQVDMLLSDNQCEKLISIVSSIQFTLISFDFGAYATQLFLPILHKSLVNGKLKQTNISEIICELREEGSHILKLLINLYETEIVESLDIYLQFQPSGQWKKTLSEIAAKSSHFKFQYGMKMTVRS